MPLDPYSLPQGVLDFLRERHLATLTTLRSDGSPHVVPVGFTFVTDPEPRARVITFAPSVKAANARRGGRAAICQVDGGRWLTLEGTLAVSDQPSDVAAAVAAYAERYRPPKQRDDRVVITLSVDRVLGSSRW